MFRRRHHVRCVYPVALHSAHVKRELGSGSNVESQYVYTFFTKRHSRLNCQSFLRLCLIVLYLTEQKRAKRLGFLGKFKVRASCRRCQCC